jgi:uncharacterized protein (DUF433 family)
LANRYNSSEVLHGTRVKASEQRSTEEVSVMSNTLSAVDAGIVFDAAIHGGEPIIEGTATTVRAIAELWNQGMSAEEVPIHLPHLQLAQVFDALRYYLRHRDEVDNLIAANRIPDGWHGKRLDPQTGKVE